MRIALPSGRLGRVFAFAAAAAWCGGCSVLFHADATQCATTQDCQSRPGLFANSVCMGGVCVEQDASVLVDAGMDGKSDARFVDAHLDSGDAGIDAGFPCQKTSDCTNDPSCPGNVVCACDPDTSTCAVLTSSACPLILGDPTSVVPPIFVGGLAALTLNKPASAQNSPSFQNYALAISEFSSNGILVGDDFRMPVAVVCDYTQPYNSIMEALLAAHVTSFVADFNSNVVLAQAFHYYGYSSDAGIGKKGLFFVNPLVPDGNVIDLARGNQLWHMLGDTSQFGPAYAALMPVIEKYIRSSPPWNLGPLGPSAQLKVAFVYSPSVLVLSELASGVLSSGITWNGGHSSPTLTPPSGGTGSTFDTFTLNYSSLTPGVNFDTTLVEKNLTEVLNGLLAFQPHVIVSFGAQEFSYILQDLEISWPTGDGGAPPPRPFYVLSPYNAGDPGIADWVNKTTLPYESKIKRLIGINAADPVYSDFNQYAANFATYFDGGTAGEGSNNFYDAMYFVVESLIGAGKPPLSGPAVGLGMTQLINNGQVNCGMAPGGDAGGVACVDNAISMSKSVALLGTLGPPDFNSEGIREIPGDVFCLQGDGGAPNYVFDVLRLGLGDGGATVLQGSFQKSCYTGFCPGDGGACP